MFSRLTRFVSLTRLLLALPAAAIACGDQSSNRAPIVDSVDAPLAVSPQDGMYSIPVTLLFHDNDGEAIVRLHYRLPPNVEGMIDVVGPNPDLESAQVTIVFPATALDTTADTSPDARRDDAKNADGKHGVDKNVDNGRGHARALEISVVDGRGAESVPQSSSVTLN